MKFLYNQFIILGLLFNFNLFADDSIHIDIDFYHHNNITTISCAEKDIFIAIIHPFEDREEYVIYFSDAHEKVVCILQDGNYKEFLFISEDEGCK